MTAPVLRDGVSGQERRGEGRGRDGCQDKTKGRPEHHTPPVQQFEIWVRGAINPKQAAKMSTDPEITQPGRLEYSAAVQIVNQFDVVALLGFAL